MRTGGGGDWPLLPAPFVGSGEALRFTRPLPGFAQPVVNLFTIVAETAGVAASTSLRRSRKAGAARMDAG